MPLGASTAHAIPSNRSPPRAAILRIRGLQDASPGSPTQAAGVTICREGCHCGFALAMAVTTWRGRALQTPLPLASMTRVSSQEDWSRRCRVLRPIEGHLGVDNGSGAWG